MAAFIIVDSFIFLGFSTLQIIFIVATAALAVSALLLWRTSYQTISRIVKYCLVFVLVFVICFNLLGIYFFQTSGFPPTYVPKLDYPNILDASLMQYLQNVEQSASFRLLQIEHFGTAAFTGLILRTSSSNGGAWLMWIFHANDIDERITMGGSSGVQYYTYPGNPFQKVSFPQNFPSSQNVKQSLDQIASLGIRYYHDKALEIYQNKTDSRPTITNLGIDVGFDELNNYQGITIRLTAYNLTSDSHGNIVTKNIFQTEFQPNGSILSNKIT